MKRPSRTTLIVVAAVALVASLVAVGRLAGLGGPAASSGRLVAAPSVVKLGVSGPVDDLARTIELGAGNRILEHVWILHDGQILRVDPDAGRVATTVSGYRPRANRPPVRLTATRAGGLASGDGGWWWAAGDRPPDRSGGRCRTRRYPRAGRDHDRLRRVRGVLWRPHPTRRRAVASLARPSPAPDGRAARPARRSGGGAQWGVGARGGRRSLASRHRLAAGGRHRRYPGGLGAMPGSVAVTTGAVWVSDPARATVWRLDPERNRLVGSVPADGWDLAVGSDQMVWATSGNRLLGLDRGVLRHTLTLGQLGSDRINAITAGPDALWVAAPTGLFRVDLATLP